MYLQIKKNMGT